MLLRLMSSRDKKNHQANEGQPPSTTKKLDWTAFHFVPWVR
jgi:hypothetical protein